MKAATRRREVKLRSALASLQREAADARPRLQALLMAGQDTLAARRAADACAARINEILAEMGALNAEREASSRAAVAADADAILAATIAAIDAQLAALQPSALA